MTAHQSFDELEKKIVIVDTNSELIIPNYNKFMENIFLNLWTNLFSID